MLRRGIALAMGALLLAGPAHAAPAKPGAACAKKGATTLISGSTYTCLVTKGRSTWQSTPTKAQLAAETATRNRQIASGDFVTIPARLLKPLDTWTGTDIEGNPWSTKSLTGRVTLVNFWASWCGPCKEEWPVLQAAAANFPSVRFVGINMQDRLDSAKAWLAANPSQYLHVFDERAVIKSSLTTVPNNALPITIVLDKQGRVAAWITGAIKSAPLEKILRQYR
jgi:thiol-disulfide isomerase/thioredoxin